MKKNQVFDYLNSLLQHTEVAHFVVKGGIEQFIYQRLTTKKFRKYKMEPECEERTKKAIHTKVSQSKPLKVVYPQGGYKLWRFPSSPKADWAEFFNIAYLIDYLLPIAQNYEPGVELVYYMHTLLMEKHDNLTTEEIQEYVDSFQQLIDQFSKHFPDNFSITILRDADIYSRDEYFTKLEEGRKQAEKDYKTWSKEKKEEYLRMSNLNIKWKGKEDWSKLSKKDKEEKLWLAALYETAATSNLEKVFKLVKAPENILLFTIGTKDFIGIGSTKNSIAKYWVGFGVLEKNAKKNLQPRILTPSQYEQAMKEKYQEVEVNLLTGRNFERIFLFEKPFNFGRGK